MSEPGIDQLKVALHEKIRLGEQLLIRLSKLDKIDGLSKLHKKVKQEINFLQKVRNLPLIFQKSNSFIKSLINIFIIFPFQITAKSPKKEHLMCTNLHHFNALVNYMEEHYADCVATMQNFHYRGYEEGDEIPFGATQCPSKITVDAVTHKKQTWVKVIARNPRALTQLSAGLFLF
jgi:Family of unknown function (DUF5614)